VTGNGGRAAGAARGTMAQPHHLGDWMGRAAMYWPERLAVVDDGKRGAKRDHAEAGGAEAGGAEGDRGGGAGRFTYGELNDRANRLAAWLRNTFGVGRGDRVCVLAPNCVEVLDAFFACGKLGAILVPLNWRLHPVELSGLLRRTRPRVVVYAGEHLAAAERLAADHPGAGWVHLDGPGLLGGRPYPAARAAGPATGPATGAEAVTNPAAVEEDVACLLFTGGTTGEPKAARISYRMIAWNTLNTVIHELDRDDVTITHTPMFHTGGLLVYTLPLLTIGGTVVLMRAWDPDRFLDLVRRHSVTLFFCVPAQFQMLLDAPGFPAADLSSVRFVTSGGAPLPVPLLRRWREIHPIPFKQGFGMTEFGPGAFSMGPEHAISKAGSIGRPNWHVGAAVVDDDGRQVPPDTVGELVLKGPALCSGYFALTEGGDGAAGGTGAATAGDATGPDGWFHTGDLARVDEDGFYFIVDRKKDMFISGGENVYPAEVERALLEHPAVRAVAVAGVDDPRWGQVGAAWVVPAPGATPSASDLVAFARDRLAAYKVPKHVRFVAELPVSPQGKVLKRALRLDP
jgi:fatty-acyl-CoA synthase